MPFRPFQGVSRAVTSGPDGQGIQKVSKTYPYERTTTRREDSVPPVKARGAGLERLAWR